MKRYTASVLSLLVSFVVISPFTSTQVLVTTHPGTEYRGSDVRFSQDSVILIVDDIVTIGLQRSLVRSVEKQVTSFPFAGLTLLTPGIVNVVFGYEFNGWGLRGTMGTVFDGETYGLQINFLRNISKSQTFSHNVSIGAVKMALLTQEDFFWTSREFVRQWSGAGIFYDLNWGGFALEVGLTFGSGDFKSPQLMLNLGYVYQFQWKKLY